MYAKHETDVTFTAWSWKGQHADERWCSLWSIISTDRDIEQSERRNSHTIKSLTHNPANQWERSLFFLLNWVWLRWWQKYGKSRRETCFLPHICGTRHAGSSYNSYLMCGHDEPTVNPPLSVIYISCLVAIDADTHACMYLQMHKNTMHSVGLHQTSEWMRFFKLDCKLTGL